MRFGLSGIVLVATMLMAHFLTDDVAMAASLTEEIAPTGKLRVAIAISAAGGSFWSTKTESGDYAGVPVSLAKDMAAQLGVPVAFVAYENSGQITEAASKNAWDVTFLPEDPERAQKMAFGPVYDVEEATYIVKPGSSISNYRELDQPGVRVAAVNNTTTMRGVMAHLKAAKVTGYESYDRIFQLLRDGEVDAFSLAREQLNAMARKIPGSRVLVETFRQTLRAVAVPLDRPQALAFVTTFMDAAATNGLLRKAYDANGLKDTPIRGK